VRAGGAEVRARVGGGGGRTSEEADGVQEGARREPPGEGERDETGRARRSGVEGGWVVVDVVEGECREEESCWCRSPRKVHGGETDSGRTKGTAEVRLEERWLLEGDRISCTVN